MKYSNGKNKKALLGVIMLFLIAINQLAYSQSQRLDKKSKFDHGILWSIQHPQSKKTSYLIGTIHVMDTNFIKLPLNQLQQLSLKTEVLCLETVSPVFNGEQNKKEDVKKTMDLFLLKDTSQNIMNSLDQLSKEKLLEILRSSNREIKLIEAMLSKIEPAMLALILTMERQKRSPFFKHSNFSPEGHFTRYANENNMQIKSLEKSEEVMSALKSNKLSFSKNIDVLKETIEAFDKTDNIDIFKNYLRQELDLVPKSIVNKPPFVERNKTMVSSIDSLIQYNKLFIMIGAAHLPNENGVLNLLQKKGYIVSNIEIELND